MKKAYKLNLVWKTVLATRLRLIYETSEHENVSSVHVITLITRISKRNRDGYIGKHRSNYFNTT